MDAVNLNLSFASLKTLAQAYLFARMLQASECGLYIGPIMLGLRRRVDLPHHAREKRDAQPCFELLDLLPDCPRGDMEFFCRHSEAVVPHSRIKNQKRFNG